MNKILELAKSYANWLNTFAEKEAFHKLYTEITAQQDYTRAVIAERDTAQKECEEQARLLGMSGTREAVLLSERDQLRTQLEDVERDCRAANLDASELRKELAELRQEIDAEPCAEIVAEDMGRPFNAMQIRTHFHKEVPPVGTQLYTHPQPKSEPVQDGLRKAAQQVLLKREAELPE